MTNLRLARQIVTHGACHVQRADDGLRGRPLRPGGSGRGCPRGSGPGPRRGYLRSSRQSSASLRRLADEEILLHTGAIADRQGRPTAAGLLAMGVHPQRFLPNAVIQASVPRFPVTRLASGHGRDEPEYPHDAVRELVVNALLHRDLAPSACLSPISSRSSGTRWVITNPGGLQLLRLSAGAG